MSAETGTRDVIIVGAGLVGLALAAALARAGLSVTIADRGSVAASVPPRDGDGDSWDPRVYAISPGSACFLHSIGAWQLLPVERIAPIEAMDVRGDAGGRIEFSAYELGERALAWIVESRALNAALVQAARSMPGLDIVAPCSPAAIAWRAGAAELRLDDGRTISARLIVGADGVHSWTREAGRHRGRPARLWPVRRRRQLRHRARASRPRFAMVSARRQRAGVAAAAGQAHLDRLVGAVGACRRAAGAGRGGTRRARRRGGRPRAGRADTRSRRRRRSSFRS